MRVLLADDHADTLKQLCGLLQTEFEVVGLVHDGQALVIAAEALSPDVIVSDISMPVVDGVAAAARILDGNPDARIVFVTVNSDAMIVERSLEMGVLGYVLKLQADDDLVPAVRAVLRGEQYLSEPSQPGLRKRTDP